MKKPVLFAIAAALLLTAGCKPQIMDGDGMVRSYSQISQEEAKRMMAEDDGHVIVDVRRQDEYDAGHIPGAILIPNEEIGTERPAELPDLKQIILIYCRSGNRSKQAAQKLFDMGYMNIYEFGGVDTWTGELVTEAEPAVLTFSSFDGGGPEYTAEIEDPSIVACRSERDYGAQTDEVIDGAAYTQVFTFTGLMPGTTTVTVRGVSPFMDSDDSAYLVTVDDGLNVSLNKIRRISSFHLYRNGEIYYPPYSIRLGPDGYLVSVNGEDEQGLEQETADALLEVVDAYGVDQWDGFDESMDGVLDGEGFLLEIEFTDGTGIEARGDNAFPENYFPAVARMQEILDEAVDGAD